MGRSLLQCCPVCGRFGLTDTCLDCNARNQVAAPLKFSPEDRQADRRRTLYKVGSIEWTQNLPTHLLEEEE